MVEIEWALYCPLKPTVYCNLKAVVGNTAGLFIGTHTHKYTHSMQSSKTEAQRKGSHSSREEIENV